MLFKKHISLLIAFLLLVSNSGLAINVHFCEGKIAGFSSVFSKEEVCVEPVKEEKACCAKPDPEHKKCCSDKEVNLKNKVEKMVMKTISFDLNSVYIPNDWKSLTFNSVPRPSYTNTTLYYCDANAPPLYQLYCQFTLFG